MLSVHPLLSHDHAFLQVWDRLRYYTAIDSIARARRLQVARQTFLFGKANPYRNFDLDGRFVSGIEVRPDRPWEDRDATPAPPVGQSASAQRADTTTVDELLRDVCDLEQDLKTRPRIVGAVALGCMTGDAVIYDMPARFSPDDVEDAAAGGMPSSVPDVVHVAPGIQRVRLAGSVLLAATCYGPTLGPAAVLTELHRCILKFLPASRSVVPSRWMDIIPRLCFGM